MDSAWLAKHSACREITLEDYISKELTEKELTPYKGPTDQELKGRGILSIFLGYYFQWDPAKTLAVAQEHGFKVSEKARTGYYNYADIDDDFISIHHYLKWYKFGFTRLFDNLSLEIRNNRITREKAVQIVKETGAQVPFEDIRKFCDYVGMSQKAFFEVIEKFRNPKIWVKRNGTWQMDGFLIPEWDWLEAQVH